MRPGTRSEATARNRRRLLARSWRASSRQRDCRYETFVDQPRERMARIKGRVGLEGPLGGGADRFARGNCNAECEWSGIEPIDVKFPARTSDFDTRRGWFKDIMFGRLFGQVELHEIIDRPRGDEVVQAGLQREDEVGNGGRSHRRECIELERRTVDGNRDVAKVPFELREPTQIWDALRPGTVREEVRKFSAIFRDTGCGRRAATNEFFRRVGNEPRPHQPA